MVAPFSPAYAELLAAAKVKLTHEDSVPFGE
jgi:hypothetical protein